MAKIQFAAFKGKSFISKLIKFWTRGDYSHIAYITNFENGDLIEAWKYSGKTFWGFSNIKNHSKGTVVEIWEKEVTEEQAEKVYNFLFKLAKRNCPYDWKGLFGFVFKWKDCKWKYFCSEGCAMALIEAGVWSYKLRPYVIHPSYFVDLMVVSGFKKVKTIII